MATFSIGDCISFGWETFKKRPGILIGAFILTVIIPAIPTMIFPGPEITPGVVPPPPTPAHVVASMVSGILGVLTTIGAITFSLRAHDNIATVELGDLWNPQPFWRFLGAHILLAIAVAIGFILLVVPGVILAVGLGFVPYLVVDRGARVVESLKESWRITKGYKWQLFLFGLALVGINLLGLIALGIGILVSVPLSWLAAAHAYRTISAQSGY
jgi:uncharacterized membrane protein